MNLNDINFYLGHKKPTKISKGDYTLKFDFVVDNNIYGNPIEIKIKVI